MTTTPTTTASASATYRPAGNPRTRFSVEYVPLTPHPPLHPPSWTVLERADASFATETAVQVQQLQQQQQSIENSWSMDISSILAAVASGLWTVAPILYLHCVNQNMLTLWPVMLLMAALEVAVMIMTMTLSHFRGHDTHMIVASFVALRVGATYLTMLPVDLPLDIMEGMILFGSSSLALETMEFQHQQQQKQQQQKQQQQKHLHYYYQQQKQQQVNFQ